jgi:8-oxo-dGTP diphosphatase
MSGREHRHELHEMKTMAYQREGYRNPIPTTDIIIEYGQRGKEGIVLIERRNPPFGYAIPGGFAEYGLSFAQNARKEALEETGLDLVFLHDEERPFLVKSSPDRDPRGHITSNTYLARGYGVLRAGDDAKNAYLFTLPEVKRLIERQELAFDHAEILSTYLRYKEGRE